MKIGIISMQRVKNYGSFLQAYGLRSTLESMGHEVVFIDYKPRPQIINPSARAGFISAMKRCPPIIKSHDLIKYYICGNKKFAYEYKLHYLKQLGIGYTHNYNEKVDIAVIGSDEVFNCLQKSYDVGFSPMLFGQGIKAEKVISYAASFGYTDLEGIRKYNIEDTLKEYFKAFSAISVRDENSEFLIEHLTGKKPAVNLDPVLISEYTLPRVELPDKPYAVLYTYPERPYSQEEKETILSFCEKNGLVLASVGNCQQWVPEKIKATPLEMLSYIKNAAFIITDTFHGSVFSIKYNKNFATLVRGDNRQKLSDLLNRLGQNNREISDFSNLQAFYDNKPDFDETNRIIAQGKAEAYDYLQRNLIL